MSSPQQTEETKNAPEPPPSVSATLPSDAPHESKLSPQHSSSSQHQHSSSSHRRSSRDERDVRDRPKDRDDDRSTDRAGPVRTLYVIGLPSDLRYREAYNLFR